MRPAFPPERPDRENIPSLFDGFLHNDPIPGSFAEWFEDAEPVEDDESEITISPHLTDAMIDEACERAEYLLAELNQAYEDLELDHACTCTVVPYTGRLSEYKPAEIEARFWKTLVQICDHCFSRLTEGR